MTCSEHFRDSPLAFPHLLSALMLPLRPQDLLAVLPTTWLSYSSCCLKCLSPTSSVNVFSPRGSARHATPLSLLGMLPLTGPLAPDLWCGRDPGVPTNMFPLLPSEQVGIFIFNAVSEETTFPRLSCSYYMWERSSLALRPHPLHPALSPRELQSFTLWLWAGFGGALAGDRQKR